MDNKKQKFLKTKDTSTATTLSKLGFQQVDNSNDWITFINNNKLQFSNDIDQSKIKYSNILCI
jgi:type V secretory pathway adhesin AidA